MAFFAPVRVRDDERPPALDSFNWKRLRIFLEPFRRATLVAVRAGPQSIAFVGSDPWPSLPAWIGVKLAHDDFHPRGAPRTLWRALASVPVCAAVMIRTRGVVRDSDAVGVAWSIDPVPVAGLLLALCYRRPLMTVTVGSPAAGFRIKAARRKGTFAGAVLALVAWAAGRAEGFLDARSSLLFAPGEGRAAGTRHGVAFSTASFSQADIADREDSLNGTEVRWIHVGGVSYEKGVDTFLAALAEMRQEADHRAVLLGALNPLFDVSAQLDRLQLSEVVRVAGRVPWERALEEMARASILVFLSRHEGMPKAPMEAMAKGLPVIVTPTGAEQYVVDGVNGLLVPVADPVACVRAVQRLMSDPDLRRSLIQGGYDTARRHCYEAHLAEVRGHLCRTFPTLTDDPPRAWATPTASVGG
ncbi:MAG TPA: glycosyltransferase [Acidimicrobiales bacterium]|nr:glycosyltransferase [Acidimicrobiales bacterium]